MGKQCRLAAALILLGGAVLCAQAPTNAYFAGPTTRGAFLNGQPMLPGTAILPAETVTTDADGAVVLTPTSGAGGAVELAANSSATVSRVAGGGLELNRGVALVVGQVQLLTPQGERLAPQTSETSYIVNAASQQTSVGVLAGRVQTSAPGLNPIRQQLGAGRAITITGGGMGAVRLQTIAMNLVQRPPPDSAMPKVPEASQSR